MSSLKRILVTGATGKQGGAVIKALLALPPSPPFELVALTRNVNSPSAQALGRKPNVTLLQGDFADVPAIFRQAGAPFYGVFSVQTPMNHHKEEAEGKALAEEAAKNGVEHFIYTSADRGGPKRSDEDATPIPHFISKFNIEERLKTVAAETNGRMRWTIIRPVAFMENLTPDFFGKVMGTAWRFNGRKMQIVSVESIGILAAEAFKNPDQYTGKSISLATDALSFSEANAIFKKKFGHDMPNTYDFIGKIVLFLTWKQLGIMFKWIREEGFGANPEEYRRRFPSMLNFAEWLEQSSKFRK
ncbi:hypothetical protein H2198_008729 [Neophaeococcomyces mojaviensis]|uniref:Uncharacterized protein n=1 Tax=Neophaeococcomyces mojaviensis TaxID=3383035 RepID=A0ACC2ZWG5_9EURO|nr:hypothetical protein H2198_008729 [Knufia sp. JES_112]